MKKIYMIVFLFSVYISMGNAVELRVIGVASNDTLNVRKRASHKGHVVATLAPFARGFYTTKELSRNPSSWVPISVKHAGSTVKGWVKRRYVTRYGEYITVRSTHLSLSYPAYMRANRGKDSSITVSYEIKVNHYDGCDMRDEPEDVRYFSFFGLSFSVYDTLQDALKKTFGSYYQQGHFDDSLRYDEQTDWFKNPKPNEWVEALNFHGKHARRIMIGAEGCGINYYFYRQSGKVIMATEPYNHNLPVDTKTHTILSGNWKLPDRDAIVGKIVNSVELKRKDIL